MTLIGVATSLTLGSCAAVAQATDAPGRPVKTLAKSCDLGFMPTKPTVTGPSILGNAFAVCDVPPERPVLTLSRQYRQGGTWKTAESTTSTAIPNPRAVYEVKTGCRPGLWRVNARVVGTLQGARLRLRRHQHRAVRHRRRLRQREPLTMPATTGRYATRNADTLAGRTTHRWRWLLHAASRFTGRGRLDQRDNGGGYTLHREWGRWTLRPVTGWRSLRWIAPAPHATRTIPGHDRDAAGDWGIRVLGLA